MTPKEYHTIVEQQADHLYRFLLKSTKDSYAAEDLVQVAFERLWKNKHKVEVQKAKSYLFTVGYNAMIDYFRKNKRINFPDQVPDRVVMPNSNQFELKEWIDEGLNTLNEVQRSLILLRDYEGYSYEEIGRITELSPSQVKVYIFRARKALKKFFKENYSQELKQYGC